MSVSTSFFKDVQRPGCHYRLAIMPNCDVENPPVLYYPTISFAEAVQQQLIIANLLLHLTDHRLMLDYSNSFFIERFDNDTQEWIVIDEYDSLEEHGLEGSYESVEDLIETIENDFYASHDMAEYLEGSHV